MAILLYGSLLHVPVKTTTKNQKRNWVIPLLESIKPAQWKRTLENPAPGHMRAFHISAVHNLYLFKKLCCSAVFSNSNIMVLQLEFNGTLLHFRATTAQVYQFWDESMVKEQYWGHIFPLSVHQLDRGIELLEEMWNTIFQWSSFIPDKFLYLLLEALQYNLGLFSDRICHSDTRRVTNQANYRMIIHLIFLSI